MILALLVGCGPKVPPTTRPDTADTADTAADSAPTARTDDDCDGDDDDANGVTDDGAPTEWWLDATRWRTTTVFEDAADQRFVAAIAAGVDATYVLVQEVAGDFTTAAISVRRMDGDEAVEIARIEPDAGLPFGYAAAVDGAGRLWIGGAWYDAAAGTRRLLAYRWDGALTALSPAEDADRVRLYAARSDAAGAWFGGYADTTAAAGAWTIWRASGDSVAVVDVAARGGEGRVEGLAGGDDGGLLAAGWELDDAGRPWGVVRGGVADDDLEDLVVQADVHYTGIASASGGRYWLGVNDADGQGWVLRDERLVDVDTGDGTVAHVAASAGYVWTAGVVTTETGSDVRVRAGDGTRFAQSLDGTAVDGWNADPHDLVVAPAGDVWLAVTESDPSGTNPTRARLLHLTCR